MSSSMVALALVPVFLFLVVGCIPNAVARRWKEVLRSGVIYLSAVHLVAAGLVLGGLVYARLSGEASAAIELNLPGTVLSDFGLYIDSVSSLMLFLIAFVGFVICRYSVRYLEGERELGAYFARVGMTIGAISLFATAGNLAVMVFGLVLASWSLHGLLLFFPDRPKAQRAAWTKFFISRLGDVHLILAAVLLYLEFGTLKLSTLFSLVGESSFAPPSTVVAAAWLLAVGAAIKSVQVPFHTWLPESLEAPTPVSALMHAGIVNAGGYLIIRLSPLVAPVSSALIALVIIGTITVCYGVVVMQTQSSIKRSLAYSTIAQMGFMLLQCGLGAFSAALLHILAHSLFKAYAFLNSGNVLNEVGKQPSTAPAANLQPAWIRHGMTLVVAGLAVSLGAACFQVDLLEKPGGIAFAVVLTLSLAVGFEGVLFRPLENVAWLGIVAACGISLCYFAGFRFVDAIVVNEVAKANSTWIPLGIVSVAFVGLFAFHLILASGNSRWLQAVQIHVANGLYIDAYMRRAFPRR